MWGGLGHAGVKVVGHEEHTRFLGIEYLDKYYTKIDPSKEIKADHPAVGDIYAPRATLSFEYQLIAFDEKTQLFSMVYLNDKCPYVRTITKDIINEFYLFKENRPVTFNFAKPAEPSKPEKVEKKSIPNYWY